MDKEFEKLYGIAKSLTGVRELSDHASCGHVGCALITDKGNIYTGICIVADCGIGFCAEHSAIAEMLKNGESRIMKIVAATDTEVCSPCGRCRELIRMVNKDNMDTLIMVEKDKIIKLSEILPYAWHH